MSENEIKSIKLTEEELEDLDILRDEVDRQTTVLLGISNINPYLDLEVPFTIDEILWSIEGEV